MKKQQGFTLTELLVCIAVIAFIGIVVIGGGYVAIHFITKFW